MSRDNPKSEETIMRETFSKMFAKNVTRFAVERTSYRNKPFRLVILTEYEGKEQELHAMLMTGDELLSLVDGILEELKRR